MKKICFIVLCVCWTGMVNASPFQVTPMRLELESGSNIGNVTVYNSGDKTLNIQVKAKAWSQQEETGEDQLVKTDELVFFPKIFKIPAHGQKNIRVGFQGEVVDKERSYRLFIRELPVKKPGLSGAQFVLQISMPVFIYPAGSSKPRKPTMQGIEVHDGALVLKAVNPSARYYSLNKIEVVGSHEENTVFEHEQGGWYVLSGATRLFPLGIDQQQCLKADSLKLTGHVLLAQSEAGDTSQVQFPLTSALCKQIHRAKKNK
ncbi:MAG: molecular chaperone [Mariprofundaceae bacterium]|nr:molecular chaperone [Mariprofundaceae bacterium]